MKYFLIVAVFLITLPPMAQATTTAANHKEGDITLFYSNDIHGETEPCG